MAVASLRSGVGSAALGRLVGGPVDWRSGRQRQSAYAPTRQSFSDAVRVEHPFRVTIQTIEIGILSVLGISDSAFGSTRKLEGGGDSNPHEATLREKLHLLKRKSPLQGSGLRKLFYH